MTQATTPEAPHEHPEHLAHHFESLQQQYDSGKLGIWLFLTTEILMFSGLFCGYAVLGRCTRRSSCMPTITCPCRWAH